MHISMHDSPALLALFFQEVDSDLSNKTHPEVEKGATIYLYNRGFVRNIVA